MKRTIAILLAIVMLISMIPFASAEAGMNNFQKTQTYSAGQFTDVKTADWFAAGVQSAYELGLMKGSSDAAFKPSGNLTVAEALAIACRLHSIYAKNGETFTQGNPWYQVYVDYAVANKIMTAGQLTPTAQITREQFAYLMCGAIPEVDLNEINTITTIPDEAENSTYGGFVYRLYRAGVLTGSDKYGTFKPTTAIQRSEVATIVTRMADKDQRKTVTLEKKPIEVAEIQLAGKTLINVGESVLWTAKALPEGAETSISWAAGNPSVATVDGSGNIKGLKAGQCNITATASNGVKKTVKITVEKRAVPSNVTLYEDNNVKIIFLRMEKEKYRENSVRMYCDVQNKTNKNYLIQCDAISINGYGFNNVIMSDRVSANTIGTVDTTITVDFDLVSPDAVNTIGGQFRIINDDNWSDTYDARFINTDLYTGKTVQTPPQATGKQLLYSDSNVEFYFDKAGTRYDNDLVISLYVKNKTNRVFLIQNNTVIIGGRSYDNTIMSDCVLPYSLGYVDVTVGETSSVSSASVTTIGGIFRVIDDDNWSDSYNATLGKI